MSHYKEILHDTIKYKHLPQSKKQALTSRNK